MDEAIAPEQPRQINSIGAIALSDPTFVAPTSPPTRAAAGHVNATPDAKVSLRGNSGLVRS